jgi:hypothetical protein
MLGSFFRKPKPDQHFELNLPPVEEDQYSTVANPHPLTEQDKAIIIPAAKTPLLTPENVALIAVILMLLAGGLGVWSLIRYNSLNNLRQSENLQHETVLDSLQTVKSTLESRLDSLETAFVNLSTENDTLAQRLSTATNIVAEKEQTIADIKQKNVREESALRAQVQRLQYIANRYEAIIAVLYQKNAALTAENEVLRGTADSLTGAVSDLGRQLEAQIRQTMSAQFKASGFRLEMQRRNDKPTIRAKRTRELLVYFELNRVPAVYQGNQELYLVITDDKGMPIASKNPVQATIKTDKGPVAIIAQATQTQNVIDNQRLALSYKLEDRLKKGTYIVSVYSDKGLLGVASFRLT